MFSILYGHMEEDLKGCLVYQLQHGIQIGIQPLPLTPWAALDKTLSLTLIRKEHGMAC